MQEQSTDPRYPDLAGKVALVTGGSGSIGSETCRRLAANGALVAVGGRDKEAVSSVVADIRARSGRAIGVIADCTRPEDLDDARDTVERELGPLDVLAALAGFDDGPPRPLVETDPQAWRDVIDGNLTSTFLTLRAFLPGMTERGRGTVVTMSSASGRLPGWSTVAYATAKAGILMLTRRAAKDVGASGVRVNAIAPSAILTEWAERNYPEHVIARVTDEQFDIARWGTPEDCAQATLFLASEASGWITGHTMDIAGGKIMV